jgi:hypothetical protein
MREYLIKIYFREYLYIFAFNTSKINFLNVEPLGEINLKDIYLREGKLKHLSELGDIMGWQDILIPASFILPPILLIASLFGPWYFYHLDYSSDYLDVDGEQNADFYFDKVEVKTEGGSGWESETLFEKTTKYTDEEFEDNKEFIGAMSTTQILVIVAIIFCLIGMIGMALFVFDKIPLSALKIVFVLAILALIFTLLPAIYLMNTLPGAMENDKIYFNEDQTNDFFGDETDSNGGKVEESWGAGWGWWAAMVAGILFIVAFVFFVIFTFAEYSDRKSEQHKGSPDYQQPTQQKSEWDYVPKNEKEVICPHCELEFKVEKRSNSYVAKCHFCNGEVTIEPEN